MHPTGGVRRRTSAASMNTNAASLIAVYMLHWETDSEILAFDKEIMHTFCGCTIGCKSFEYSNSAEYLSLLSVCVVGP